MYNFSVLFTAPFSTPDLPDSLSKLFSGAYGTVKYDNTTEILLANVEPNTNYCAPEPFKFAFAFLLLGWLILLLFCCCCCCVVAAALRVGLKK